MQIALSIVVILVMIAAASLLSAIKIKARGGDHELKVLGGK